MATSETTVLIHEITRITPSSDSQKATHELSLPLTFFDTYLFKLPPARCLFFFQLTESFSTPSFFNSVIIPKLKHSLSLALAHYLPLSGNLKWPSGSSKPIILYKLNDSVSLTIAESNENNFHILSSKEMHKAKELDLLVPQLISSNDKSEIISFQITLFPHQGFSIGSTVHHGVLDGRSATMLMRSWAYLCKQGNMEHLNSLPPQLTPYFDRSIIKDPAGLDMFFLNQWLAIFGEDQDSNNRNLRSPQAFEVIPDDLVQATFKFSPQDIKSLRGKVFYSTGTNAKQLHLSRFVLTLAYTTICLVKARGEGERLVIVAIPVDCRTRLDPHIPRTFTGNCIMSVSSSAEAMNFMDGKGLAFAVGMISNMVLKINEGLVFEVAEKNISNFVAKPSATQVIFVNGSNTFNFYETDFGLGTLKKTEMIVSNSKGKDEVFVVESGDGSGGIEVVLALKKHEMENFATFFSNGLRKQSSKL